MQSIELLSPAGDLECLETALHFGADAVYVGGPKLQLRAANVGFTMETLAGAVLAAHRAGRKLYVTVNSFATNAEIPEIAAYARELYALGVDAAIVADIGVLAEIKKSRAGLAGPCEHTGKLRQLRRRARLPYAGRLAHCARTRNDPRGHRRAARACSGRAGA